MSDSADPITEIVAQRFFQAESRKPILLIRYRSRPLTSN